MSIKKNKILVTGGCGYIGGHTIVDLVEHGYEVISVDNLSRGKIGINKGVSKILNKEIKNYYVDLCNLDDTEAIFSEHPDISGIIHFAALKSVPESVERPLLYFYNNNMSLINLLQCCKDNGISNFLFSSSCSVYGNADQLPVTEKSPLKPVTSPYARTKVMGEGISTDFANSIADFKVCLLRYFNPVGAHPSALIGEMQDEPENLVPVITQTAIGKREKMYVFGNDYDTRDGSCIRDYIHVMDIAHAHTLAMERLINQNSGCIETYNLGTGHGVTVLELIHAFENVTGVPLNYEITRRREGDVIAIYADNTKAKEILNWTPKYKVEDMMRTAWAWEKSMNNK